MGLTREEALRLAEEVDEYRSRSYVEAARGLGRYVRAQDEKLRTLTTLVENIAKTDPEARDGVIAAAVTAARSMVE